MNWKADTLASIDALLDTDQYPSLNSSDRAKLRQDIWRLVIDQTGLFVHEYRTRILNDARPTSAT